MSDNSKNQIRAFDIFHGGGGSSRGACMAGARPVGAIDMWSLASEIYGLNFPSTKTYCAKADSISPEEVHEQVGDIDLLLASPECTSHSVAKGKKPGCENSRSTAFEVPRFAAVMKPRWIVVENVIQMKSWHRFDEWKREIESLGYKTNMTVLDARNHRTAQSRRRLFVVAELEAEPKLPNSGKPTKKTVRTILGRGEPKDSPWRFTPLRTPRRAEATIERAERAFASLGKKTPFVMVYYGTDGSGGFQCVDRPLRTVTTLDRFAYVRPTGKGHEMRMLQPPELAAAMGFTQNHQWGDATRRERIKLIGNAVCPAVMCDVIKALTTPC